ncbi:ATP-binding cassette sub-family C member 1, partial [Caligus rogercresseyi]
SCSIPMVLLFLNTYIHTHVPQVSRYAQQSIALHLKCKVLRLYLSISQNHNNSGGMDKESSWLCEEEPIWETLNTYWADLDDTPVISSCLRTLFLRLGIPNIAFFYLWLPFEIHSIVVSRDRGIKRSLLGTLKDVLALALISVSIFILVNVSVFGANPR